MLASAIWRVERARAQRRACNRVTKPAVQIGVAGWSLAREIQADFPPAGSQLARYATRLGMTEINSCFSRRHRAVTYERWAEMTPSEFCFSVKLPRTITHEHRLVAALPLLEEFLSDVRGLGSKLGCILVQLPPSLAFEPLAFARFASGLRNRYDGLVALEPRHASWFGADADQMLAASRMARVLADPALHAPGALPGGWPGLVYLRLHGSPRIYWSSYGQELLQALAQRIALATQAGHTCWCVFDNTAGGQAVPNALELRRLLQGH